jgi:hypothetical protein
MRYQKDVKENKQDMWFEIRWNVPVLLFWLVSRFDIAGREWQRFALYVILWIATLQSTAIVGLGAEYILRLFFVNLKKRSRTIAVLFPMSLKALLVKLLFMSVYAAILASDVALRKSLLFFAPYVWLAWLIFWAAMRLWLWIKDV